MKVCILLAVVVVKNSANLIQMANSVCLGRMEDNKIICSDSHRHIFHVYCACTRARDDDFDEDQWMTSALVAR